MWVNYLLDFLWWLYNAFLFVGSAFGFIVFLLCLRGNIKVKFFDWEDEPR